MKNNFIYVFFLASLFVFAYSVHFRFFQDQLDTSGKIRLKSTSISVDKNIIDVGKVNNRELARAEFFIKNTGTNDLIISEVNVSCTCSSAVSLNEPIAPNDSSKIVVQYNKKMNGYFFSDVLIHGNFSGSPKILSFEGFYLGEE